MNSFPWHLHLAPSLVPPFWRKMAFHLHIEHAHKTSNKLFNWAASRKPQQICIYDVSTEWILFIFSQQVMEFRYASHLDEFLADSHSKSIH